VELGERRSSFAPLTMRGMIENLFGHEHEGRSRWQAGEDNYSGGRKAGSLGFRLVRDTTGVMMQFRMRSIEGPKEGAVIMENGHAEMHTQRSVLSLVTRLDGPWVEAGTPKNEDLIPGAFTE